MTPALIAAASGVLAAACMFQVSRLLVGAALFERIEGRLAVLTGRRTVGEVESRVTDLGAAFASAAAAMVLFGFGQAVAAFAAVPAASLALRRFRARRQRRQLEDSMPGQLRALADGLRVGRTLEQAAADCGRSGTVAGGALERFAAARIAGAELGTALRVLADDRDCGVWEPVAVAVALNRRCGGDLPAALCGIAGSFEAIAGARSDADATMAQARFTARLVLGLPVIGLAVVCVVSPGMVLRVASNPVALAMASAAAVLQLACMVVIRRIAIHACR